MADIDASLNIYKFLCKKIGNEQIVSLRRLIYTICDIGRVIYPQRIQQVISGSKGEGLNTKGSDMDFMYIDPTFQITESYRNVVLTSKAISIVMDTDETLPCFTKLRFVINDQSIYHPHVKQIMQTDRLGNCLISSKLFKIYNLRNNHVPDMIIHGPCVSDRFGRFDFAMALKCNEWITPAQHWASRPRSTWPQQELITKIILCGVSFVPVGCKGSINESEEWRISFSVAEKFLIFSFNHTQLLCYGLLKILIKEIVEKQGDMKGLVCSYFIKTMMFWILEESNPSAWRPDNIISCFNACLKRLLYCIEYSILLHYFIPDNNLFYLRINSINKNKLISILNTIYQQGIHCFALSESLSEYRRLIACNQISDIEHIRTTVETILPLDTVVTDNQFKTLLHYMLYYSRTCKSAGIFTLFLSQTYQQYPKTIHIQNNLNNKQQYFKYKFDFSHMLISLQLDAVSGWLRLASFFYVRKNYLTSMNLINYALWKCTDEKVYSNLPGSSFLNLNRNQESLLKLIKLEKPYTALKMFTVRWITFNTESTIIPPELQLEVTKHPFQFPPLPFAYFLRFLCYYNLKDFTSCAHSLPLLQQIPLPCRNTNMSSLYASIFLGIAYQMMSQTQ